MGYTVCDPMPLSLVDIWTISAHGKSLGTLCFPQDSILYVDSFFERKVLF